MKQLSMFDEHISDPPKHKREHWKLFVDGAARKNPGPAGAGIHIVHEHKTVKKVGFYLGTKTNNQAEYAALLLGLYFIKKLIDPHDFVDIISDSELLVKQLKGDYRVKHPDLKPLYLVAKTWLHDMHYAVKHVLREFNVVADEMANKGIDEKIAVPPAFKASLKSHGIT
jgi:ribonuclease HI